MRICWWNVATWLLTGLLMFTVGLIIGALLTIGVITFLWVFIVLAVVWFVLLVLVRVSFYIRCRKCWENN